MTPSFALTIDQIADNEYPEKHGFDPFTEPKTLIIPLDGENLIGLFNSGQMIINESDTSVVKIVRDEPGKVNFERKLTLKGISEGTAFIEVRRDGFIQTQLEVAVLKKKNVRLSFQFVEDGFKHRTKRNQSQIFSLITELNKIYIPQTNIEFSSRLARNVRTGINLGKQVNFPENLYKGKVGKASRREWDAIVKLGDKGADINVFFVHLLATNEYLRNCRKDKNCYASDLMGYHAFKNCMIDDDIEPLEFAGVVAHETGHALTIIGHNPKSYYLMTDHSTLRTLISKVESVKMNLSIK